jgi:hypothetical protein
VPGAGLAAVVSGVRGPGRDRLWTRVDLRELVIGPPTGSAWARAVAEAAMIGTIGVRSPLNRSGVIP